MEMIYTIAPDFLTHVYIACEPPFGAKPRAKHYKPKRPIDEGAQLGGQEVKRSLWTGGRLELSRTMRRQMALAMLLYDSVFYDARTVSP